MLLKARKKQIRTPNYYCSSCTNCTHRYCNHHNRPVQDDYNRCFYHSTYAPIQATLLNKKIQEQDLTEYVASRDLLQLVG